MAELTHAQYDQLERAIATGARVAVQRRGRREYVFVPLRLRAEGRREVIDALNPTTGDDLMIYVDEIDSMEIVA